MRSLKRMPVAFSLTLLFAIVMVFSFTNRFAGVQAQATPTGAQMTYINTATTTSVRNGFGQLYSISINGGTGGAVTLYDIASVGCTGTPASGKFATIASSTAPVTMFYEGSVKNGLCVVTAAATDVTVSWN